MSVKIISGVRDKNRLAVFDNKMREIEVQQSATNYFSTRKLNGRTGTFTITKTVRIIVGAGNRRSILAITNNDPINLMVLDRIFVQTVNPEASPSLPDFRIILAVDNIPGTIPNIPIINENRFSNKMPNTTALSPGSAQSPAILATNIPRIFATDEGIELIPQGSNGIIIPGGITPTFANKDTISVVFINNTAVGVTYTQTVIIRFMMVPPDQLG